MDVAPPQDEAGSSRAARRERVEDDAADRGYGEDDGEADEAEVPSDFAKLRACIPCKLIKTHNQVSDVESCVMCKEGGGELIVEKKRKEKKM